jgi:hypothetical protein
MISWVMVGLGLSSTGFGWFGYRGETCELCLVGYRGETSALCLVWLQG